MPTLIQQFRAKDLRTYSPSVSPVEKWEGARQSDICTRILAADTDLDTDGKRSPLIDHYDSDHQDQVSYDPSGRYIDSNLIPYTVSPPWLMKEVQCPLGSLVTVIIGMDTDSPIIAHSVLADIGPKHKFGEASIQLHRLLGHETVRNRRILNDSLGQAARFILWQDTHIEVTASSDDIQAYGASVLQQFLAE